jgi:hypothetical protein
LFYFFCFALFFFALLFWYAKDAAHCIDWIIRRKKNIRRTDNILHEIDKFNYYYILVKAQTFVSLLCVCRSFVRISILLFAV